MYLRKAFDRFCYKNADKGIRNLPLLIIIVKLAMFVIDTTLGQELTMALMFDPRAVLAGQWWRIFSFMLIGNGNLLSLAFEMLFVFFIGKALEGALGRLKFTLYYFSGVFFCVAYAGLCALGAFLWPGTPFFSLCHFITSAPLNTSLLLAFATLNPDASMRLYFIIPIKAKWLAVVSAALLLYPVLPPPHVFTSFFPLAVIGSYFLFFFSDFLAAFFNRRLKPQTWGKKINFERAARNKTNAQSYTHRCAKCGLTNADLPGAEFRYCSLCAGYECYCGEHIFTHEHKTR